MKDQIKKVALELFMKYGLKSVSMDDIAKAAGISKKTIYQNITDKESLVHETLLDFIIEDKKHVLAAIQSEECNALEKMVLVTQQGIEAFKKIKPTVIYDLQKYYHKSWKIVSAYHFEFMVTIIKDNITQGITEKVYRQDIDPEIVSKLFIGKMVMVGDEEQFPSSKFSKSYLYMQQLLYHLYGLVSFDYYKTLDKLATKLLQPQ